MTNTQFLDYFYNQLNKVRTLQGPGYDPLEISLFASEAQELLVLTKYNPSSNTTKEGFEETEKRLQDIGNLVQNALIVPQVNIPENMPNGVFVDLPNTLLTNPIDYSDVFWLTIFEQGVTSLTDCTGNPARVNIYEINHGEYAELLKDPFNRPSQDRIWRLRVGNNRHELVTDGTYSITGYHVRYIRKPRPIDLTGNPLASVSELADITHRELVRKTVELVLDDTENRVRMAIEAAKRKE